MVPLQNAGTTCVTNYTDCLDLRMVNGQMNPCRIRSTVLNLFFRVVQRTGGIAIVHHNNVLRLQELLKNSDWLFRFSFVKLVVPSLQETFKSTSQHVYAAPSGPALGGNSLQVTGELCSNFKLGSSVVARNQPHIHTFQNSLQA